VHITNASEVAVDWETSTYSGNNGNCVQAGAYGSAIAIRDSKNPTGPALVVSADAWSDLIAGIKSGRIS
jgi:predicted secreted Zn-dependent protease